jgi:signal transduction histidine kinase
VQLQQVMLNLLRNAVDAMRGIEDRPRTILLRTDADQAGGVRLMVQDSGAGLDAATLPRLFEPFYTTKETGMGIGLSVSRTIIESHGGQLWALPDAGPGATFFFSLPRAPAIARASRRGDGKPAQAGTLPSGGSRPS